MYFFFVGWEMEVKLAANEIGAQWRERQYAIRLHQTSKNQSIERF